MPGVRKGGVDVGAKFDPCGQTRNPTDIAGRVNDLVNCYLIALRGAVITYLPLALVALVLIVIMLLAANQMLKDL